MSCLRPQNFVRFLIRVIYLDVIDDGYGYGYEALIPLVKGHKNKLSAIRIKQKYKDVIEKMYK